MTRNRGLITIIVVIVAAFGALTYGVLHDTYGLDAIVSQQGESIHSKTHSKDILLWCRAIDQLQRVLLAHHRADVRANPKLHFIPLHFDTLNCAEIVAEATKATH